jgi:hypothetical protein
MGFYDIVGSGGASFKACGFFVDGLQMFHGTTN